MASYVVQVQDVASAAVVGTFRTLIAIIGASGKRMRVLGIRVVATGEAAADAQMKCELNQTNQAGAGTPATSPTPKQMDSGSAASIFTAGTDYTTAEPTTYDTIPFFAGGANTRGVINKEWGRDEAPVLTGAKTMGLRVAPGDAAAHKMTAWIHYEEF